MTGGLHGGSGSGGTIVTNADGFSTVRGGFGDGGSIGVGEAVGNGVVSTITRDGIVSNITTRRIRSSLAEGMGFGGPSGAIVISKDGGEIVIDNAPNGAALHTGGGRIAVGRSEGRVTASTGGGDIELEDVTGDASATTGAGDVRINVVNSGRTDHSINVESGSGRVVIEVPRISTRASSWKAPTRTTSTERRASPATSRSIEAKRTVGTGARERLESTFARMASSGTVAD